MGKCLSKSKKSKVIEGPITLKHFDLLRSVGKGAFGKVRIVKNKSDKQLYALKYINKQKCIEQRAFRNTIFERNLLETLEHPLIVNLRYAFQDEENMFMVIDLMLGGDLKYHLQQQGTFPEEAIKFYAAEMICSLAYLHGKGVVHRDIKPDNLLLDERGHIHLTDFNVTAYLPEDLDSKLKSFSGTLTYMAPEVIQRSGYREEVDWWGMGVVLYEFLYGKRPFRGKSSKEVASKIVKSPLQFPSNREDVSDECIDFISRLLEKNPEERLGSGPDGLKELKEHPFLSDINWTKVEGKELKPVFIPSADKANFNALFEAEDILMEKPLKSSCKRKGGVPLTADEEYIVNRYREYNYRIKDAALLQEESAENLKKTFISLENENNNVIPQDDHHIPSEDDVSEESN